MRNDICAAVYSSPERAFVHSSTFGENSLAMRAGLATLDVAERENLAARRLELGEFVRQELRRRLSTFEMLKEVRGLGLFSALQFHPPASLGLKLLFGAFSRIHAGLFGQMLVKTLFEEAKILSQMAGNNYMVIKSLPPLIISKEQLLSYVGGIERVCQMVVNPDFDG
jgi:acetylornithine/succinyldiaminopimelate/putrescine aminotransferase